ncbi:MAG: penicillin acylase family protein [Planctomycetaceae bacterium]
MKLIQTLPTLGLVIGFAAELLSAEPLEIVRDRWGVAHVFADSEEALFYGAGYAMAEDRLLQMMLVRSEAEGRLAELLGPGEEAQFIESDKTFRLLGFDRHARKLLGHLQPDTRRCLEAFAAGVNAFVAEHPGRLSRIVDVFPQQPRAWEAADSLAIWARNAYQFTGGWEGEVQALRKYEQWATTRKPGETYPGRQLTRDDSAAVISEEEFQRSSPEAYQRLKKVAAAPTPDVGWFGPVPQEFKASHAWVVSGARSMTGKPILESNPQIPVSFPTSMYEIHLSGGRYDVRGVTFPGCPAIFIGWNRHCAWGATALGGDHADLFQEKVDPENSSHYLHRGKSLPFEMRQEVIAVKGRDPISLSVRETIHGPVVNGLLDNVQEGEVFALKHILTVTTHSSVEAQMEMMRAKNWASFREGMRTYVGPACNLVFADDSGTIAYQSLVMTPKRRKLESLPRKGWTGDDEWEMVEFDDMPSMVNPTSNTIFSANHLPIGSWYPYLVSTSRGDGPRSWRLRELLAGNGKLSVDDFHRTIHLDSTNGGVRDFVTLATLVLREDGRVGPRVEDPIRLLEAWDGRLVTNSPAFPYARAVLDVLLDETKGKSETFAQFGDEWAQYDASWSGLNGLLKQLTAEFRQTGNTPPDPEVRTWLKESLVKSIRAAKSNPEYTPPAAHRMPYQNNMGQWGSLAPQYDIVSPPLTCPVTQTIWSQGGETFVHNVDLSDIDNSRSLLPPGVSEDPASPHSRDQVPIWVAGEMHPAPITREGVLAVKESVRQLTWPAP